LLHQINIGLALYYEGHVPPFVWVSGEFAVK
jgi:hypothetical protein